MSKRKPILIAVLLHFIIFMTVYTAKCVIGHALIPALDPVPFPIERWLIWVLPSVILITIFKNDLYVSLKELFFNKVRLKTFLWCTLPIALFLIICFAVSKFTGFVLGGSLREFSSINEFLSELLDHSYGVLIVPAIPEEMAFRAWIQNALLGKSPSKKQMILAVIISSIMFAIMHLPSYIFILHFSVPFMFIPFFTVFVIAIVFGIAFLKSKNILVPIFLHWLYDVFFGMIYTY